ncbi:hypothetical protein F2P79_002656 [Pimephales promelas]|nr:hypothetical protein F2P79_002656 [Pimephales promelas]
MSAQDCPPRKLSRAEPAQRLGGQRVCGKHHRRSQIFQHVETRRQTEAGGLASRRRVRLVSSAPHLLSGRLIHHHRDSTTLSRLTRQAFLPRQAFISAETCGQVA